MVDIFCLIPIHIAIARDNRFVPLKDGVWAPETEKALLGAEIGRIVDSLSLGWYESIFQSYMSTKVSLLTIFIYTYVYFLAIARQSRFVNGYVCQRDH